MYLGRRNSELSKAIKQKYELWLSLIMVESVEEIMENIDTIDSYLASRNENEVAWAKDLIRRGRHFIAVPVEDGFRFYPSKFMGYVHNTMSRHDSYRQQRNGRATDDVISDVLGGAEPKPDYELECQYKDYCDSLGLEVTKYKRGYWLLSE
ncbi:MAG: hypothetical protein NC177_03365 [Ruminococcus flavefaciens]|nr:hypothetical protein [Ruminococcus flavefaciens]